MEDKTASSSLSLEVATPFTAFPNVLLDTVMPTLKDTEWRLLCVIVRQTIGWQAKDGRRKSRDWLTQSQLMAKTGRNSAALSAAVDALVRRRFVDAWDEAGELLLTPQERRRCRGRVYFGLCADTFQTIAFQTIAAERPKTPLHKANTTKETKDKKENIIRKNNIKQKWQETSGKPTLYTGWRQAGAIVNTRYFCETERKTAGCEKVDDV